MAEFATAGSDGILRLWQADMHTLTASLALGSGPATALDYMQTMGVLRLPGELSSDSDAAVDYSLQSHEHLAVGRDDGCVLVLDAAAVRRGREYQECLVVKLTQRTRCITDVKFAPNGAYLAVASYDNVIDVYMVKNKYTRWGVCRGHRDVIRHMDWASDSCTLRSNDSSQELLHWNVKTMRKGQISAVERAHELNDLAWCTATCPMTWATQGPCQAYSDASEIAAVDRSPNGALLVAADVYGTLRVFRYPCVDEVVSRRVLAHPGPVTNVRFVFDDSCVISLCGADMCLLQWKLVSVPKGTDVSVLKLIDGASAPCSRAGVAPGAMVPGQRQESQDEDQMDLFKPFHSGVFPPKAWQADEAALAAPVQELELDTVHGCHGHDRHGHTCFNNRFHAVYYTAKIVIVQDREHGLQRFFLGHTEDVSCIAPHPHGRLFASAQAGTTGLICVWDSQRQQPNPSISGYQRSLHQLAAFTASDASGVAAMSFSASGRELVTVSCNANHDLTLWDWGAARALCVVKGSMNRTLAIACQHGGTRGCERFVTCGVRHVRFWQVEDGQLTCQKSDLSSRGVMTVQLSCTYSREYAVTGNDHGFIYVWRDSRLVTTVRAHAGPVFALHTAAAPSQDGDAVFCSAGGDGIVKLWAVQKRVGEKPKDKHKTTLRKPFNKLLEVEELAPPFEVLKHPLVRRAV